MPDVSGASGLSVGRAAARIGVAASTLRTWERRYGLVAERPQLGRPPALHARRRRPAAARAPPRARRRAAGRAALLARTAGEAGSRGAAPGGPGPGRRVLAVPGADARARGSPARPPRWTSTPRWRSSRPRSPVRGSSGCGTGSCDPFSPRPARSGRGPGPASRSSIWLTEAAIEALRAHRRSLPRPAPEVPPVVLACAPHDEHTRPLHVLAAALRERGMPARLLGARVPAEALAANGAAQRRAGGLRLGAAARRAGGRGAGAGALPPRRAPRRRRPRVERRRTAPGLPAGAGPGRRRRGAGRGLTAALPHARRLKLVQVCGRLRGPLHL